MMKHIKYYSQKAKEVDDRVLRFIGSTEDVDRDGEVIKLSGWKLANYRTNPIVLCNHNPMDLPVAKTKKVWVDKEKRALMFDVEFPEPEVSPQGDTLYKLYKNGFMNSTSVGFIPNRDKMIFGDRTKGEPHITFKDQELLEISLVSVPANPAALLTSKSITDAVESGVVDQAEITDLEIFLKDFLKEREIEVEEEIDTVEKKVIDDINRKEHKCKSCGVVLECLCPGCKKEKETEDYFSKIYNDVMFERTERSA